MAIIEHVLGIHSAFMEPEYSELPGLLEAGRAGDAEAFGEVCRAFETRLLRQAFALCRDEQLAEDLAQETLVEAWRGLRRFNGKCEFFTWLCAILLNLYRNTLRKKRLVLPGCFQPDREGPDRSEATLLDPLKLPDESLELQENAALVQECIRQLPTKHQQVVYLRFFVDDSLEGIAAALGCSVGTVKSRLFHALEKLRAMRAMVRPLGERKATGASHESV